MRKPLSTRCSIRRFCARARLDPALAEYFRGKPRFAEGRQQVTLLRNGEVLGEVEAEFDAQGQLCFSPALLEWARLQGPPPDEAEGVSVAPACYDFVGAWPQTQVQLNPNLNRVALLVPTAAILPRPQEEIQLESGGVGGMLNYDLSASLSGPGQRQSQLVAGHRGRRQYWRLDCAQPPVLLLQ
ncbi:hypothetical protein JOS77_01230 [Chromobacterium haemolyticum]|nr:hypothetical protein JOS77_01230 [Chromobacterium haemolyticum]